MLSLSHNHHKLTKKGLSSYICHVNGLLYFTVVEPEASLPKPETQSSRFHIETVVIHF